ncbi:MAG: thermonuclease family protein [Planctomycetaceae bacterium]|jgi:endonuclease YncB( thermonuclease family)|nr:thermonuclease family protein [Planctomycetaceae bacterium]
MARRKTGLLLNRRAKSKIKKIGSGLILLVALPLILSFAKWAGVPLDSFFGNSNPDHFLQTSQQLVVPEGEYKVVRCVDGDTIDIFFSKRKVRIRLIGANTPETVKPNTPVEPFGPEASQFTKRMIAKHGNRIRMTYDGATTDKYGRTLAMVWLGDVLLNELLIQNGLAKAELQYHYSQAMKNRFQAAENEAKRKRLGIWSQ